jgi:hypothetical protein
LGRRRFSIASVPNMAHVVGNPVGRLTCVSKLYVSFSLAGDQVITSTPRIYQDRIWKIEANIATVVAMKWCTCTSNADKYSY